MKKMLYWPFILLAVATSACQAEDKVDGEAVYTTYCISCHGYGVAGAPLTGDKVAWQPRIAKGMDKLVENAIKGINAMPPKGLCNDCTAEQLKAAIELMVNEAKRNKL